MSEKNLRNLIKVLHTSDPIYHINEKEFDQSILMFGSLMSILKNKRINQTMLLIEILENKKSQKCFIMLSDIDNLYILLYNFIYRYPILCKSKIVKNKLKKSYERDKRRTKRLQQISGHLADK